MALDETGGVDAGGGADAGGGSAAADHHAAEQASSSDNDRDIGGRDDDGRTDTDRVTDGAGARDAMGSDAGQDVLSDVADQMDGDDEDDGPAERDRADAPGGGPPGGGGAHGTGAQQAAADVADALAEDPVEQAAREQAAVLDAERAACDRAQDARAAQVLADQVRTQNAVDPADDPDTLDRAAGDLDPGVFQGTPASRAAAANAAALPDTERVVGHLVTQGEALAQHGLAETLGQDAIGGEFADANVVPVAGEIVPQGEIFGQRWGAAAGADCCSETEAEVVQAFRDVVADHRAGGNATEYELGATIHRTPEGEFGHNLVVTNYTETAVSPFLNVPEGATPVATIHSHPKPTGLLNRLFGYDGEDFSDRDMNAAITMQERFGEDFRVYMISPIDQVRVYPPAQ